MSIAASLLSCPSTSTSVTFNLQAKPKEGEESNKQAVRSCRIRRRQLAKVQQQEAAYHGTKTSCFRDHDPWTGTLGLPRDGPPYMHDLWTFVCPVRITNNIFCYRKVKRTAATAKAWRRLPHALPAHSWVIGSLLVCGMPPNSIKLLPICNSVDRFRYLHSRTERERERERQHLLHMHLQALLMVRTKKRARRRQNSMVTHIPWIAIVNLETRWQCDQKELSFSIVERRPVWSRSKGRFGPSPMKLTNLARQLLQFRNQNEDLAACKRATCAQDKVDILSVLFIATSKNCKRLPIIDKMINVSPRYRQYVSPRYLHICNWDVLKAPKSDETGGNGGCARWIEKGTRSPIGRQIKGWPIIPVDCQVAWPGRDWAAINQKKRESELTPFATYS
jgi:hypothetical protein